MVRVPALPSEMNGSHQASATGATASAAPTLRKRATLTVPVSMGQGLGLASISEARASACVSIYSRTFVSLPFRTVMSKTQWSSNVLFVALILSVAKPTTRTRSPCAMNLGGSGPYLPCGRRRHRSEAAGSVSAAERTESFAIVASGTSQPSDGALHRGTRKHCSARVGLRVSAG